jgi:tetraprenyl-beta-curcumene synthase
VLRRLALITQRRERGNLEGAAAFAVLAPRSQRARVVRAVVAFQAVYDYIDTLAEQPSEDPVANGHQLHLALLTALSPSDQHSDYYLHSSGNQDAGYMRNLIDTCRFAFGALPSHASVLDRTARCAKRMMAYQALNHGAQGDTRAALAGWSESLTPAGTGLRWWETAAAAASSLSVFALIAAAAQPVLRAGEAAATEDAYFPWIGALHVLLDSLIDRGEDLLTGHHCLVDHYSSAEETASRVGSIAAEAMQAIEPLPNAAQHSIILAAMTSFYLTAPAASTPQAAPAARSVRARIGTLTTPTMAVLRARRAVEQRCGVTSGEQQRECAADEADLETRNSSIGFSTCSNSAEDA